MSLPFGLKPNDIVYFIPYTTDIPQIRKGRITDDWKGELFITYCAETENNLADNGEWYICRENEIDKTEIKIKIFNLLQRIKLEE